MSVTGNQKTSLDRMVELCWLIHERYGIEYNPVTTDYHITYNNCDEADLVTVIFTHRTGKGQIKVKAQFENDEIVRFEGVLL